MNMALLLPKQATRTPKASITLRLQAAKPTLMFWLQKSSFASDYMEFSDSDMLVPRRGLDGSVLGGHGF